MRHVAAGSVGQMGYGERKALYEQIEELRGSPLMTYMTSARPGAPGLMATDAIREFVDQIQCLPPDTSEVDVLIISHGGDPVTAWRIISLLRERVEKVHVLIPWEAFSAATLLALGADSIYMHRSANLGPVDIQLQFVKRGADGQPEVTQAAFQDLVAAFEFGNQHAQNQQPVILQRLAEEFGAGGLGFASRGDALGRSLAERLLKMHMGAERAEEVEDLVRKLNEQYFSHGYALSRSEAIELGLNVTAEVHEDLEELMWAVWRDLEVELEHKRHFVPLDVVTQNNDANDAIFGPVPILRAPLNAPPGIVEQWVQQVARQIQLLHAPVIEHTLIAAVVESTRCRSRCVQRGRIVATRTWDLDFKCMFVPVEAGWETDIEPTTDSVDTPAEGT